MRRLSILQRMPLAPVPYSEGDQHPAALPCWGRAVERGFFRNREGEFICRSNLGGTDSISACSSWFGFPQTPPCCRQHYQTPHPHCIPGILRQIFCFHLVTKVISLHCLNEAFTFSVKAPFPLLFFGAVSFHFRLSQGKEVLLGWNSYLGASKRKDPSSKTRLCCHRDLQDPPSLSQYR